jgi:hypothetical protein
MSYLTIHGVQVEAAAEEWEPVRLGAISRSLNGAPRSNIRATKREHRFTSDEHTVARAELARALIEGEGHSFAWEDSGFTSSRGLVPTIVTDNGLTSGDVGGKWGLGLFAPVGSEATWAVGYTGDWTVMYWRYESTAFVHYLVRKASGGSEQCWRNGVRDDGSNLGLWSVTVGGALRLLSSEDDDVYDDVVVLPYLVPEEWIASLYAYANSRAFGALPFVVAQGEGLPAAGLTCMGLAGTGRRVMRYDSAGDFVPMEVFDFTLHGT